MSPLGAEVLAVAPEAVRPLRGEVLRPGMSPEALVFALDGAPATLHAAVLHDGAAVSIGTVMAEPHPREPAAGDWRVRGMATRPDLRRKGLAAAVLAFLEADAREQGGRRLWCNARLAAVPFYEQAGLEVEGERFEIESIGPHHLMSKRLD